MVFTVAIEVPFHLIHSVQSFNSFGKTILQLFPSLFIQGSFSLLETTADVSFICLSSVALAEEVNNRLVCLETFGYSPP